MFKIKWVCPLLIGMMLGSDGLVSLAEASCFDAPSVAPAQVDASRSVAETSITVSSVPEGPDMAPADRWIVKIRPRQIAGPIVDYGPRTQTATTLDGSVLVKITDESSDSSGISIDSAFAAARGHVGADQGTKQVETTEFRRLPELQAVIASGTIERGRGVVYRLTASPHAVLEGEKTFRVAFEVPPHWRGGMLDVDIAAFRTVPGKYPWDKSSERSVNHYFSVALYRKGDSAAQSDAEAIAMAESRLWDHVRGSGAPERATGWMRTLTSAWDALPESRLPEARLPVPRVPSWVPANPFTRSQAKMSPSGDKSPQHWVSRVVRGTGHPLRDRELMRLPVADRVLALDYLEAQHRLIHGDRWARETSSIDRGPERVLAAKAPVDGRVDDRLDHPLAPRHGLRKENLSATIQQH